MVKEVALGIDIGGTTTTFGIVDHQGNILADSKIMTHAKEHVTRFLPRLYEALNTLINDCPSPILLKGAGIGAPNGNYLRGTVEKPANLRWGDETPLAELISKEFGVPTVLTNDANAAALGEMRYGATKGMKNFLMITLGTGLGSGLVVDGKLVYGHTGFAGELGHMNVKEEGREGPFGLKGSLEAYVSVTGIRRTVSKMLADSAADSQLRDISYNQLTGEMITDAALKGDKIALAAFDYTGQFLGKALATAILFLSPEAIVLFGGLANAKDLIFQPTLKHMDTYMHPVFKGSVKLMLSELQHKNAAVLGSAALIWEELDKRSA